MKFKDFFEVKTVLNLDIFDCPEVQEQLESNNGIYTDGISCGLENWDNTPDTDCPYALGDSVREWLLDQAEKQGLQIDWV